MSIVSGRFRAHSSTLHRELQGEAVLLQLDTGEYFGLDRVGQRMWELMIEHGELDTVVERLADEYDAERDVLAADLSRLVDQLIARKLIERNG